MPPSLTSDSLNNWDETPAIHREDILNFKFLIENEFISELTDEIYSLTVPLEVAELAFEEAQADAIQQQLSITDVSAAHRTVQKLSSEILATESIIEQLVSRYAHQHDITIREAAEILDVTLHCEL